MPARRTTAALSLSALALAAFGTALPSGAADTEVQFTVAADSTALSVAVGAATATVEGSGDLLVDLTTGTSLRDTLPTVTLTDGRGQLGAGWTVSVVGEDFVSATDSVPATGARVYNNVADATTLTNNLTLANALSGMTILGGEYAADTGNDLGGSYALLTGSSTGLLEGSITITPTIDIAIPAGTQAGTYKGTVSYTAS